jgi:hypothetical protein
VLTPVERSALLRLARHPRRPLLEILAPRRLGVAGRAEGQHPQHRDVTTQ